MKKLSVLRLSLFLMIICTGCDNSSLSNSIDQSSSLDLPSSLSLVCEIPIDYPRQLSSYSVQWINVEQETVLSRLMNDEDIIHEYWAEGECFRLSSDIMVKILYIYNGILHGGLNYHFGFGSVDDVIGHENDFLCLTRINEPDLSLQGTGMLNMFFFSDHNDLSFSSSQSVSKSILSLLSDLGFQDVRITNILARDKDTANKNRNIYNDIIAIQENENNPDKESVTEWVTSPYLSREYTEADEDYFIVMSETIDNIPFSSTMNWVFDKSTVNQPTDVVMTASYNQSCGLSSLFIENYFDVLDQINTLEIIPPEQALQVYLNHYNQSIHLVDTSITKIELNYVVIISEGTMIARPCWMVHTERPVSDFLNPFTNEPYYEYPLFAISADTGLILTSNEDMR